MERVEEEKEEGRQERRRGEVEVGNGHYGM